MKSTKSAEDIIETANSKPRPIKIPSMVAGYMADLIIQMAKNKSTALVNNSYTHSYSNCAGK